MSPGESQQCLDGMSVGSAWTEAAGWIQDWRAWEAGGLEGLGEEREEAQGVPDSLV